jgi:hypothetical protein
MKKINSIRNLLTTALFIGGIFIISAGNNVYAQDDGGHIGSGVGRNGDGSEFLWESVWGLFFQVN